MKKKAIFKKAMSLLLTLTILVGTVSICLPILKIDAGAVSISSSEGETITQTQIVTSNREITYGNYAAQYLNGAGESTGIVIPGLDPAQDYVIQGMTYYPQKDWMLVTAYHNDATYSSKVFCLDAKTGEFVAMLSFKNVGSETLNMDHGGGIAISEHNLYYSCGDMDRKIAYAPLSALDGIQKGEHRVVQLAAEAEFTEIGSVTKSDKTAYTAYVCYDQGYLWMGNFYDNGADLLGIDIAATDYNAPATSAFNSMVYGYKLKGDSSADEWNNLINGTSDCKGSPTHAIALENNIKDVQYAVVDNGKLYLSCSFGSGAGNSVSFGFGETSKLITADIDLSAQPTTEVQISTSLDNSSLKTIKAHRIDTYETYEMMPMSEGLCIINDLIFCTFESASNKYKNESSGLTSIGNCEKPVDVIWKIDPYALKNESRVEDPPYSYYEKVNSLDEIKDGDEYLIVYESPVKDPVTQQNILYAIDANGGFKDYKLSKNSSGNNVGYVGAIGHPITEYSIDNGRLYLGNAEKDDVRNLRWKVSDLGNYSYSIQSPDYYFVNQPNFYFDASTISMTTDLIRGNNIKIQEANNGEGGFWISNGEYFLWCNDGTTESYRDAYNKYYTNNSTNFMYSGVTEQAGTFHTDALNKSGSNVLGGEIVTGSDTDYAHGLFYMYRRVVDRASSTFESRVYTDMKASLQADGTYTIDLETYAISPNHYMPVDDRPTDYIIVMDKSQSAAEKGEYDDCDGSLTGTTYTADGTGLRLWPAENYLSIKSLCNESDTELPASKKASVNGYAFSKPEEQVYIQHAADGMYYKIYLAVYTTKVGTSLGTTRPEQQYYWAYYIADDGLYYVLVSEVDAQNEGHSTSFIRDGLTREQFYQDIANAANGTSVAYSGYSHSTSNGTRQDIKIYRGAHATYTCGVHSMNVTSRITTIKEKAKQLVDEIAEQGSDNRIAITYYGDSSYYLNTDSAWATSGFTKAFWNATTTNRDTLKNQIDGISNISDTKQTDTSGMEMYAASSIMQNSDAGYKSDGTRNCVIIFISDGVPGEDGASDPTNAANNVIAKAHTLKENGAFIFTTIVGEDTTSFDKNKYMEAVSSKYPAANSMAMSNGAYTDLGGASVDGVIYTSNLGDTSYEKFAKYADITGREFVKNEAVGIANLDVDSILNEELTSAFKPIIDADGTLADGIEISCMLVPGSYDKVERFSFDENSASNAIDAGVTLNYDASNSHKLSISGYDYGEKYISKEKTGYKLKVRITGVEANEAADITNTSINNTATTAIYQVEGSGVFKYFPTEYFNIPTYTYVLDYDLPMYDSDINGTLCSVDSGLYKQDPNNYNVIRETDNVALNFVNENKDMTYELMSGAYSEEDNRSFCLIKRDDGTYDWFRINIVPASNVLFEENRFDTSTAGSSFDKSSWSTDGTEIATYQTLSGENDRYGYDSTYANNGDSHSNGTAYKTTVNSTKKRSDTMTFSYTGTGFELMAACGANTGIQIVNIKNAAGAIEKVFMVDTYFVDTANFDGGALLKQVPIVSYTNEGGYGEYTVEVTAAYLSTAQGVKNSRTDGLNMVDSTYAAQSMLRSMGINVPLSEVEFVWYNDNSVLNGGTGPVAETKTSTRADTASTGVALDCYIDSIRVYNPLGDDSSLYIDSEKGASYHNIVNELASGKDDVITSDKGLFAYVVGELKAGEDGEVPTLSFSNYQSVGPQHEIYLQSATGNEDSHAVAFNVIVPNSDSRVMISLRAVSGATTVNVASGSNSIKFEINTATEQYFDITPYLDINTSNGVANVVITNIGEGLLSVNNLKLVDATAQVVTSEDLPVMARSLTLSPRTVDPNSYDYDAIVDEGTQQQPEVEDNTNSNENPVTLENIITKIVAILKKLFEFIFSR